MQLLFSLVLVVPSSYLVGRVHQWYTHSLRRDSAFQDGYNHASRAMFTMAMRHRVRGAHPTAAPPVADDAGPLETRQRAVAAARRTRKLNRAAGRLPVMPTRRRWVESPRGGLPPRHRAGHQGDRPRDSSA